ncbi:hypothetical protein [Gulosibacter hominis]|uniref:hypothetical protein n=1 Tax=Gulosibacter hominis TaxID=2770504 RepID=UPI001917DCB3|nr:hypothetical protein [Gulosibacter hominis]
MKKLTAITISLAAGITLTACAETDSPKPAETTPATTKHTQEAAPKITNESICERVAYWSDNIYDSYETIQPEIAQYVGVATDPNLDYLDQDLAKFVNLAAVMAAQDGDGSRGGSVTTQISLAKTTCQNLGY